MPTINVGNGPSQVPTDLISFVEVVNNPRSPRYILGTDRSKAVKTFDVDWDDVDRFSRAIIGYPYGLGISGGHSFSYIKRRPPLGTYLKLRGASNFLYADEVEIEGFGVPDSGVQNNQLTGENYEAMYEKARLTISFTTRPYDIISDAELTSNSEDESSLKRYVTKVVRPAGELLTLDSGAWFYCGSNPAAVVKSRGTNKLLTSWNLSLTWEMVPKNNVPSSFYNPNENNLAIDKCLGRVNKTAFANCPRGTLLLVACEIRPVTSAFGERTFAITYSFKYFSPTATKDICNNTVGHNHVFYPKDPRTPANNRWYEITTDQALAETAAPNCTNFVAAPATPVEGRSVYEQSEFSDLFRPAQYVPV